MSTIKTTVNDDSVLEFISQVPDAAKREDSLQLLDLFSRVTGEQPKMWGSSIIGFGSYHYKSERSNQEGDWPLVGFSPRKANLTLYITHGFDEHATLLEKLGKHKTSKGCLYINKLSDIDTGVLGQLVSQAFIAMKQLHSQS